MNSTHTEPDGSSGTESAVTTDEAGLKAWRAMMLAHAAAVRAIGITLNDAGHIPLTWYDVLSELNASPDGRLRMVELAERGVLSRSQVSRIVDKMATVALVTKTPDPGDGRVKWAAITEKGVEAVLVTAPTYLRGVEQHFSRHLAASEKPVLTTALTRVRDEHTKVDVSS